MSDAEAYHLVRDELPADAARLLREMQTGRWYTKEVLHAKTGISTHALSARMSDLRKMGVPIEKRHAEGRVYLYRVPRPDQVANTMQEASA